MIVDPELAGRILGGTFQADNVEAFIHLLEAGFDIAAEAAKKSCTIPAGVAESTLRHFSQQAGVQFVFDVDKVTGLPSRAILGTRTKITIWAWSYGTSRGRFESTENARKEAHQSSKSVGTPG